MYHANLSLIDKKVFNYLVPFPTKFSFYNFLSLHRYADYKILKFCFNLQLIIQRTPCWSVLSFVFVCQTVETDHR